MSYYDLWTILANWRLDFSVAEFSWTFASPDPRKVLHDMVEKGLLERSSRGRYRVRSMVDYARARNNVEEGYRLLSAAEMPYSLTGADGVFVWTHGGYNAGRFFGFYPIHIKVLATDVSRWHRFFKRNGKKSVIDGLRPKETIFGVFYVLYPRRRIKAENRDGLMVVPLSETFKFCHENSYTFGPAINMLPSRNGQPHKSSA